MAVTDIYHISGGLKGRHAVAAHGTATGVQIDEFMVDRVAANDTTGTFTAWFNVPDTTGTYCIIGGGDANAVQYFYLAVVAGQIQAKGALVGPDVCWDLITTGTKLRPHVWHHVALVHDAVKPKIYIDSVEYSLTKGNLTETDVTEPTYWFDTFALIDGGHIGCADSIAGGALLTLNLIGAISDVKYWNTNLTDAQILDDYNEVPNTTSLISHWKFDGDYLDAVTASNNDGTAVGDITLTNNYSEFTSRFRNDLAAAPLVADKVLISTSNGSCHAIIIKAA